MKALCLFCCLLLGLPAAAQAANDKIDPAGYICAELVTQPMTEGGEPPIFTALQIDGYASAKAGNPVADSETLAPMLGQVYAACQAKPTETVLSVWQEARKTFPAAAESRWRADKTTCRDYAADTDNGSGFVIWLDGYNRGKSGKSASVLNDDATLNAYFDACAKKPDALMLDVMGESAR
ncbi:MAG: hypothetical protein E7022_01660 [Desulfovibrio desulfuricans]|jgi:hypothetical protein|uniref:HdeA/HdeB family chaperone n=1 Tax=uncultured Desulfovibrio sp. TaxID=167968 RepID=UPI00260DD9AE|nr:HdeA/HdeB family chaperone [uncultured Desulfovibrio sp.]MBE6441023.1 hypothetical protein [Desulfovibrio desulfuricans]